MNQNNTLINSRTGGRLAQSVAPGSGGGKRSATARANSANPCCDKAYGTPLSALIFIARKHPQHADDAAFQQQRMLRWV